LTALHSLTALLQIKQETSRQMLRERRELSAYKIRLRHERPMWKNGIQANARQGSILLDSGM